MLSFALKTNLANNVQEAYNNQIIITKEALNDL